METIKTLPNNVHKPLNGSYTEAIIELKKYDSL
jgi:hypothetical protein